MTTLDVEKPLVSVLVTVCNGMPYIIEVLQSLLGQSYPHIEIIVVDDASTDATVKAVEGIIDPRLILLLPNVKLGRGKALNYALAHARGEFVAINDADDPSHQRRIERQVEFLMAYSDYGMVGSFFETLDMSTGLRETQKKLTDDTVLRIGLTNGQQFQHSTVMFRKSVLDKIGGYDEKRRFLYDREIFLRVGAISKFANIPEVLVTIYRHPKQHFYYTYQGRIRILHDYSLRLRAIKMFGLSRRLYVKVLIALLWGLLPPVIHNLVPRSLKTKFRA